MMRTAVKILAIAGTLLLITAYLPGVVVPDFYTALLVALVLGLLNIFVRPVLVILTLPLSLLTMGLFTFVLNAVILWLIVFIVPGFALSGFLPALGAAVILSAVSWVLSHILP
ncbi:MAG: phage holin family protein [Patescibacteria group bacterium]